MADVKVTPAALGQLARLPRVIRERVAKLFTRLKDWPRVSGIKALSGNLAGWYRARTGDYRVRFRIDSAKIIVDKIGHRSEFYEKDIGAKRGVFRCPPSACQGKA